MNKAWQAKLEAIKYAHKVAIYTAADRKAAKLARKQAKRRAKGGRGRATAQGSPLLAELDRHLDSIRWEGVS